jgi:hypothetical protein
MKLLGIALVFFLSLSAAAQRVGIGTTNPDLSSILEIKSDSLGILIPRLSTSQMNNINNPANGLLVYNSEKLSFWYYDDGAWNEIKSTLNDDWYKYYDTILYTTKSVGIGTYQPHPSAALEIYDTTKGILIPRLTNSQRNAITNGVDGLLVFDIEDFRFYYYTPGGWQALADYETPKWVSAGANSIKTASASNVGINTITAPQYKLDVGGRMRIRTNPYNGESAGIWLDSATSNGLHSFIGIRDDSTVGIWGQKATDWGLVQNATTGNVGIGTTAPHRSAIMELKSTNKAFLPTRMTLLQMKNIPSPRAGMIAYDTEANTLRVYDGTNWVRLSYPDDGFEATGNNELFASFASSGTEDVGTSIATDAQGNVYILGYYYGDFSYFGINSLGSNNHDAFLVKLDSLGNTLWTKTIGDVNDDYGVKMVLTPLNQIVVCGTFETSTVMGPYTLNAWGVNDVFLNVYDVNGNFVWTQNFGGDHATASDYITDIEVDAAGNIYVIGSFNGTMHFTVSSLTFGNYGETDAFVAKFANNGALLWAKAYGGNKDEMGDEIALDGLGNIYCSFSSGSNSVFNGASTTNNYGNALLIKMDASGNTLLSQHFESVDALAGAPSGGVFFYDFYNNLIYRLNASLVQTDLTFTTDGVSISKLETAANGDIIILGSAPVGGKIGLMNVAPDAPSHFSARLSAVGTPIWYNPINISGQAELADIDITSNGSRIYVTGYFYGSMKINNGTISSIGGNDLFIWKYLNY